MIDDFFQPDSRDVLSVTALTRQIKGQLEQRFSQVWVQGEISNLRRQSSGHVYFSLKDNGSQLPSVLFARDAAAQSFELEDGMEILLFGDLSVYEPHGRYQLIGKMTIRSGQGRLYLEFERLKRVLAAEGLFDPGKKQALPNLPERIAVISSPSGAAIRDFLRILKRRNYKGTVTVLPARVQGKGASKEIEAMLETASNSSPAFDLIVLTRGGGSIEDLWAFNEEPLARAVAACPIPTLSAIGHEIDTVLTDFAADVRAETPSAAAELISSLRLDSIARFNAIKTSFLSTADNTISDRGQALQTLRTRYLVIAPQRRIDFLRMRLDDCDNRLRARIRDVVHRQAIVLSRLASQLSIQNPTGRIKMVKQRLNSSCRALGKAMNEEQKRKRNRVDQISHRLENSSISSSLRRGYVVMRSEKGEIIERANNLKNESELIAQWQDGSVPLTRKS